MHYKQYKYLFLIYKDDEVIFIYSHEKMVKIVIERNLQIEYTYRLKTCFYRPSNIQQKVIDSF